MPRLPRAARRALVRCPLALALLLPLEATAVAQFPGSKVSLGIAAGDALGENLDVHGDLAVAAAPDLLEGYARVYRRGAGGWAEEALLAPWIPGASTMEYFGTACGISEAPEGAVVAVGAPYYRPPDGPLAGTMTGAVFTWRHDGAAWQPEQVLVPADAKHSDLFGFRLALDGDVLVVGAPGDEPGASGNHGAALVWEWNGSAWVERAQFFGAHPADQFGDGLSVCGIAGQERVVVGAYNEELDGDPARDSEGAAYVFRKLGGVWEPEVRLTAPGAAPLDIFGWRTSLSADTVVVSAPLDDEAGPDAGAVYVFHAPDWSPPTKLVPAGATPWRYGETVSLGDDLLVVGAPLAFEQAGACYAYRWDGAGWGSLGRFELPDPSPGDRFGFAAVDRGTLAVGAPGDDDVHGADAGAVYFGSFDVGDGTPPVAVAGPDRSLHVGDLVALDGSDSYDDTTATADLSWSWTLAASPDGSGALLAGADTATPSFLADVLGEFVVELVVTDEAGNVSAPDRARLSSLNGAPTALAGADAVVLVGTTHALDGSGSSDPDGDPLTFAWVLLEWPEGSLATLGGADTATPSLVTDVEGRYLVELTVADGYTLSDPAQVTVDAITPQDCALDQLRAASQLLASLAPEQFDARGHQHSLLNQVSKIVRFVQQGSYGQARSHLLKLIERTDGVSLRGAVDPKGLGQPEVADFVTDPVVQVPLYALLTAALDCLP